MKLMQPPPIIPIATGRFAAQLALFYAATFALAGTYMPFFPLWLTAAGLEPGWIGIVAATPTVARLIAVPIVTAQAERRHAIRGAIVVTAVLTFIGFAMLGQVHGATAIILTLWLTACAWTPILPLTDAYALRGVTLYRINYGPIRLWGSAAYAVGALAAGTFASQIAPDRLIWIIAGAAGLGALASLWIAPIDAGMPVRGSVSRALALLRDPAFLAVISAAALIQGSHAAYYTFSAIGWQAAGFGPFTIAMLWALCVAVEIVLFASSPRMGIAPAMLIAIGGAAAALRWIAMAQEPSIGLLVIVQPLHALSFGATHLGTMGLLARLAPGHVVASAQGYLAVTIGVVSAVASILCGQFYGAVGLSIYYGMAVMAVTGCAAMLAMRGRVERRASSSSIP